MILYGIANCDKVRAARKWLASRGIDYRFHDFRKDGLTTTQIEQWLAHQPLSALLNKRSTTWRQLSEEDRNAIEQGVLSKLICHPTLIKRPVLDTGDQILVGFDPQNWQELLS